MPFAQRSKVLGGLCSKLNRCKAQSGPTLNFPFRSLARCDALGRRAAEGVPDSRAEAEGLGRAEGPMRGPGEGGVIWWSKAK